MPAKLHPVERVRDVLEEFDNSDDLSAEVAIEQIRTVVDGEYYFWNQHDGTMEYWFQGYMMERLKEFPPETWSVNPELILLREWVNESDPPPWLNSGHSVLQHLVSESAPSHWLMRDWRDDNKPRWEMVTRRDWIVATAIIRWLGTNVGRAFVDRCFRLIDRANETRRAERHAQLKAPVPSEGTGQ